MRARNRRLDDNREAELLSGRDRLVRVGGEALGHERQPVGQQQLASVGCVQPDVVAVRERASDDAVSRLAFDAVERRDRAVRLAQPLRALSQPAERARCRLR